MSTQPTAPKTLPSITDFMNGAKEPEQSQLMSPTIGKLMEALSKVQGELKPVKKTAENPFFKSHYADLEAVVSASQETLAKHGLAVVQLPRVGRNGVELVTTLGHISGEWIRGFYPMTPSKADPQGLGSAYTYARRYNYQGAIGVVTSEDDDGNAASGRSGNGHPAQRHLPSPARSASGIKPPADPVAQMPAPDDVPNIAVHEDAERPRMKPATPKQINYLAKLFEKHGVDGALHKQALKALTGYDDVSSMTVSRAIEKLLAGDVDAIAEFRPDSLVNDSLPDWGGENI